ncbi:MAG: Fe-S cluster assembly protein SufD [Clostridium sp.]|jgi:FeS assembly protein SufD|uniref:Fe-S cluster assembly protein SufD n=1 Tax=Clostridium sp. TaxID=1506 RepID=UPI0025B84A45|nr:Fe-S cluster assembly protein SufD [Clostridium sp.]MCH3963105.1 Fe-S cluster assembly protein SufD [Clostridium sp.]MCI1716432.1 Fe-S cluster assembly protein SufD [Clostridium sp.]MCI1800772.1 Fe-S cluster assembly protein SufD [Clostridium sp.]MCI1814573.1 Fe-S cluster assembly protein SufD [Clostridium sp.]MCI1871483.1 Fe-S cluster assembly protein SufD [Clostridium sp.]
MDIKDNFREKKDIISTFENKNDFRLNQAYVPTWRYLGLNDFHIENYELPEIESYKLDYMNFKPENFEGITVVPTKDAVRHECLCGHSSFKNASSVSKDFVRLAENGFNSGIFVKVPENKVVDSYIRLNFNLNDDNPTVIDNNIITAEPNSRITLLVDYSTQGGRTKAFHNGLTRVIAKAGSEVNVIKIQRMNDLSTHFDSNMAVVESGARVNWVTIEIGSGTNVTNYNSDLNGDHSSADIYSAYLVDGDRKQDLYYTTNHFGRESTSNMVIEGVLKDRARKVFKGNIDFRRGSSKSKGAQAEEVLLLDPTVKTDSVPILLCQEEDVDGQHAASVGKIDENQLFYLMSRGLDYSEAEKLVIEARFSPIFDRVPADDLKNFLSEELRRRLVR